MQDEEQGDGKMNYESFEKLTIGQKEEYQYNFGIGPDKGNRFVVFSVFAMILGVALILLPLFAEIQMETLRAVAPDKISLEEYTGTMDAIKFAIRGICIAMIIWASSMIADIFIDYFKKKAFYKKCKKENSGAKVPKCSGATKPKRFC